MQDFWQGVRTGSWLTAERARVYPLIVLGLVVLVAIGFIATSDGLIDRTGKPIGTDFSNVYAAGTLAWASEAGFQVGSTSVENRFPWPPPVSSASSLSQRCSAVC